MFDKHLSILQRVWKWFNINRVSRMHKHYEAIRYEIRAKTPAEKKEFSYFSTKFEEYYRRTSRLVKIRLVLYLFLYASVIVNVLRAFQWLELLVGIVQFGNALLGTTVILALVILLQTKINLQLELMNESLTHMIVLYHKHPGRNTNKVLRNLSKTL